MNINKDYILFVEEIFLKQKATKRRLPMFFM